MEGCSPTSECSGLSKRMNLLLLESFSYNEIGREAMVSDITLTQLQTVESCKALFLSTG